MSGREWKHGGGWRGIERLPGNLLLKQEPRDMTRHSRCCQAPLHLLLLTPVPVAVSLLAWDSAMTRTPTPPSTSYIFPVFKRGVWIQF